MEVTVRVMSQGQEIDSITCTPYLEEGIATVTYRQKGRHIIDGCIYLDETPDISEDNTRAWASLIHNLLPVSLPDQVGSCTELLHVSFRKSLPHGIAQAVASLSAMRLEQQARALLVDFFKEHRDADRLLRLLHMQLLFQERLDRTKKIPSVTTDESQAEQRALPETDLDWEWTPSSEEMTTPDVDDHLLRTAAADIQEGIGSYRAKEGGAKIPELDDADIGTKWSHSDPPLTGGRHHPESMLLDRAAKLGPTALSILRYFAENPGDRAVHAETILGHPISEINRLLLGSLSHYFRRDDEGGWECYSWVSDVLTAIEEARNTT